MVGIEFLRYVTKRPDALIDAAIRGAIADAERLWEPEKFQGEYPEAGLGIRRLVPSDLIAATGASDGCAAPMTSMGHHWSYSIGTASQWQTWFNTTLSDACYVVITGIFSLDALENVTAIKFSIDGKEYPITNIQELYCLDVARAYFTKPIVIRPEKTVKIEIWSKGATIGSLGLLGHVVAKRSYLIVTT